MRVDELTIEVAGSPVFIRRAPSAGTPAMFVHGVPTSSDDWADALRRTGGIAPDLPGFGRSGKASNLDYSIEGQADFLERMLRTLEIERVSIVAHDWGAASGLTFAERHPARVQSLVLCNPLPLVETFSWHRLARLWRMPGVGEIVMGSVNRRVLARALRRASASADAWPDERVAAVWEQFDQGTQRAILRVHRATDKARNSATGTRLHELRHPCLILWGARDPWFQTRDGERLAARLANATFELVPDAGHWPWLDRPELIDRIAGFLEQERDR